jgi:hypothetical protein
LILELPLLLLVPEFLELLKELLMVVSKSHTLIEDSLDSLQLKKMNQTTMILKLTETESLVSMLKNIWKY